MTDFSVWLHFPDEEPCPDEGARNQGNLDYDPTRR
jgi:hypothetical protein